MTEQELTAADVSISPFPSEIKRKLDDLETQIVKSVDDVKSGGIVDSDVQEAKRLRLDEKSSADENGHQEENVSGQKDDKDEETLVEKFKNVGENDKPVQHILGSEERTSDGDREKDKLLDDALEPTSVGDIKECISAEKPLSKDNPELDGIVESAEHQVQQQSAEAVQEDSSAAQEKTTTDIYIMSRKMEVPHNKVGVLIGKAGDTIRCLQINSGTKIHIARDAEAHTATVEMIGSLESLGKAKNLINDVISEADAGGAPSLVARGIPLGQAAAAAEQIQMNVPNDKVGMIIGKGGRVIKNLEATSGARIQLIPQHLPDGDQSKEHIVRVSGDKRQIEIAREMLNEAMSQPVKRSRRLGGYNQQTDRFHEALGSRGGHYGQPFGYDYHQRACSPQNPMRWPPALEHYPGPQYGSRAGYGSGWQQQPPMHRPSSDNYGRSGHFMVDGSAGDRGMATAPNMVPIPYQTNHNYGQPHSAEYRHPSQCLHAPPAPSGYGGYDDMKYGTQAPFQHPYAGQPPAYYQGRPGYAPDQQFGKPAPYAPLIPSQAAAHQTYCPSRPVRPEAPLIKR